MTQSRIRHAEQKDLIEDRTLSWYQPYQPIPKVKTGTRSSPHTPDPWPCGRPSCSGNKAEIGSRCSRGLNQLQPLPYIKITSTVAHWHGGPNHFIGDERRVEAQSDGLCWTSGMQMRLSVFECGRTMTSTSVKAPLAAGEHQRTHDSQQNDSWNRSCACNTYTDRELEPHTCLDFLKETYHPHFHFIQAHNLILGITRIGLHALVLEKLIRFLTFPRSAAPSDTLF